MLTDREETCGSNLRFLEKHAVVRDCQEIERPLRPGSFLEFYATLLHLPDTNNR